MFEPADDRAMPLSDTACAPESEVRELRLGALEILMAPVRDHGTNLAGAEAFACATMVPARRQAFSTGRWLAREALRRAGLSAVPIARGAVGEPLWPPGVTGSLSHSASLAAAAVASRARCAAVGIDLEMTERVSPDLHRLLFTTRERDTGLDPTLLFSAKEACYKFLYPLVVRYVDFLDIEITCVDLAHGVFRPRFVARDPARAWLDRAEARFVRVDNHWLTAVYAQPDHAIA